MAEQLPEHQPKTMRVKFLSSSASGTDPYHGRLEYKGRCVCGRETPWCLRKQDAIAQLATHLHSSGVVG